MKKGWEVTKKTPATNMGTDPLKRQNFHDLSQNLGGENMKNMEDLREKRLLLASVFRAGHPGKSERPNRAIQKKEPFPEGETWRPAPTRWVP